MIDYIFKKTFYINKEYNIISSLTIFLVFYTIIINIIISPNINNHYLKLLIILLYPMLVLQTLENIIYDDFYNGEIELMLTLFSTEKIILYQFISCYILTILSYIIALPFIILLSSITYQTILLYSIITLIYLILINILSIFLSTLFIYIKRKKVISIIITLPLLLSIIIITSMVIDETNLKNQLSFIKLMIGIIIIISSSLVVATNYLLKEIYNS